MKSAIGMMSGTSMDGIDLAVVYTDGEERVEFGPSFAVEYSQATRARIETGLQDAKAIENRSDRIGSLARLELEITELHGAAVREMLALNKMSPSDIDVLGFHGQTVLHRPEDALTVQLGLGDLLAKSTGIDVVCDMRAADMEAGGQGAPLVPVFHRALSAKLDRELPVCFVNIGGISNITYVDGDQLIAFDSGPGNALIDQWVQANTTEMSYDAGGKYGLDGEVVTSVLDQYLASAYFEKTGPKSLDRNDFPPLNDHQHRLEDGARTLARLTALSIVRTTEHLPKSPKTWIVCGGGRLNAAIMQELGGLIDEQGGQLLSAEDVDLSGDMLEAQAFGYLAVRSLRQLPLTFPSTTGCRHPVDGGVFLRAV